MIAKPPVPNATNPPLPVGEDPGRRVKPVETVRTNPIFISSGLKDGLDIAKCIALGVTLGGMAGNFLKAAAVTTEKAIEMVRLTKRQIEVTMFAAGLEHWKGLSCDCKECQRVEGWEIGGVVRLYN